MVKFKVFLYLVSKLDDENETDHGVAYTKNELQLVNDKEVKAQESAIRPMKKGKQELYYVEKVMDKQKKRNRIYYLIKFKGISTPSLEPKTELIKYIPDLLKVFMINYHHLLNMFILNKKMICQ